MKMKILFPQLVLFIFFYQTSCSGQNANPNYVIAKKKESIMDFSKRMKISEDILKKINPKLHDVIKKGDTINILSTPEKNTDTTKIYLPETGKNNIVKEIDFLDKAYLVCEVDPHKYKIELFNLMQNNGEPYSFNSLLKAKKKDLLFIMNGGMYEPDYTPVGLYISAGKTYNPVNLNKEGNGNFYALKPNGIFMIDSNNNAKVLPTDDYVKAKINPVIATQSGPMLLVHGVYNSNFQRNSTNFNIRNGVGINKQNNVVFVLSIDPVNFYEFSQFFKEILNCDNALYFDGVISQAFAPGFDKAPEQRAPLGIFVAVSKKTGDDRSRPAGNGKNPTNQNKKIPVENQQ